MKLVDFEFNQEQIKAFTRVISAIKSANSKGLRFFGVQDNLVAYQKSTLKYI